MKPGNGIEETHTDGSWKKPFVIAVGFAAAVGMVSYLIDKLKDPLTIALLMVGTISVALFGFFVGRGTREDESVRLRELELEAYQDGRRDLNQMYSDATKMMFSLLQLAQKVPIQPALPEPRVGLQMVTPTYAVDNDKMITDAKMIYTELYNKGIHPTQAVLKGKWPMLFQNHEYMTECLDYLAVTYGVVTPGVKGKERTWIYSDGG